LTPVDLVAAPGADPELAQCRGERGTGSRARNSSRYSTKIGRGQAVSVVEKYDRAIGPGHSVRCCHIEVEQKRWLYPSVRGPSLEIALGPPRHGAGQQGVTSGRRIRCLRNGADAAPAGRICRAYKLQIAYPRHPSRGTRCLDLRRKIGCCLPESRLAAGCGSQSAVRSARCTSPQHARARAESAANPASPLVRAGRSTAGLPTIDADHAELPVRLQTGKTNLRDVVDAVLAQLAHDLLRRDPFLAKVLS